MDRQPKALPSAAYLRERFAYDPKTGDLRWRKRPRSDFATANACNTWNAIHPGHLAGWIHNRGYFAITLGAEDYLAHRVIWKMMKGIDPKAGIDHRNGDGFDNRWPNLRAATQSQNLCNRRVPSHSKTGVKGVRLIPGGRYGAHIRVGGKFKHLGCFDTIAEAHAAHCEAARQLHGEFFNPG